MEREAPFRGLRAEGEVGDRPFFRHPPRRGIDQRLAPAALDAGQPLDARDTGAAEIFFSLRFDRGGEARFGEQRAGGHRDGIGGRRLQRGTTN